MKEEIIDYNKYDMLGRKCVCYIYTLNGRCLICTRKHTEAEVRAKL